MYDVIDMMNNHKVGLGLEVVLGEELGGVGTPELAQGVVGVLV